MKLVAVIGGSGFDVWSDLTVKKTLVQKTSWGSHSGPVLAGDLDTTPCVFLPRHAAGHKLPPHKINYRANIWLLKELGVTHIVACNVVGGITGTMAPDTLVVPDQIIDYTSEREHTFYDGCHSERSEQDFQRLDHIDFSCPYSEALRQKIIGFFDQSGVACTTSGVYGCTQGPRLETVAEITRMKQDGCDIVGMTGMPEAALAREAGVDYVCIGMVVNWAAGVASNLLSMAEITQTVKKNVGRIKALMPDLVRSLQD